MRRKNTTRHMMKQYIAESLFLLMERERYADITIEEITRRAGVNRSTYYRNFSSKEEIVKFFFREIMNTFILEYESDPNKSFFAYLNGLFEHLFLYKEQLILLYQNELFYIVLDVCNAVFQERQPQKFNDSKEMYSLYYHIGGIYNFFLLWVMHGMTELPRELAKIAISIFPPDAQPQLFSDT